MIKKNLVIQLHLPDRANVTALIEEGEKAVGAQSALVARRFPAAALQGCGFKTGCHETGNP